jgi:outer membrane lipoprotein-sorting protein
MKKTILVFALFVASTIVLNAQTVDEVVNKHLAARGGAEKLRAVKTLSMENTLGAQGMEFENKMMVLVGKMMRSDSKIMGNDMVQAFDGETAWAIMPSMMGGTGEQQAMPDEMGKGVASQTDPFPLLDYAQKGSKLELLGNEKVKDKDAYHLKMTSKDGSESEIWIDVENGFVTKVKATQAGQEAELFYSNFKETDGLHFPMTMETSNPMAGTITIDTKSITINGTIDEAIFKFTGKK